jgi:hypothetical protein
MADYIRDFSTNRIPTKDIGQTVDEMVRMSAGRRLNFERKWYDNNFFDDGHHYRFLSRASNKIVDVSERATVFAPMRAIPKTSRQIRGIANLLVAPDYMPVVYPEKVSMQDPQAVQKAKDYALKTGRWLQKEWQEQDFIEKIAFMVILAAKHGVAWLQVWPDAIEEAIKTQVYDAFDIYVMGQLTDPEDSPFMVKAIPQIISQIKANEYFDKKQIELISPDNKMANSEIKQAYMSQRYNRQNINDQGATLLLKEAYIKEYLNEDNTGKIKLQDDADAILKNKKKGDMVMRQVFVAGNIWLRDRYVNLPGYPFVDFRFEPGPIYNVPLIERFIPVNKSFDALVSRAERYSHTMVTGSWSQRTGEQYEIENGAGGQIFKYASTPPIQNQIAPIPQFFFELMGLLSSIMEEQGVAISMGHMPQGVKAHAAIESLKETEYSNLVIASRRLKGTVKRVAEKMLDIADNNFIKPQTVYDMKDGNPQYFDVIGASALENRKKDTQLMEGVDQNIVPLRKDYKVEIEIQTGMGYTEEGRKAAAKELGDYLVQMAQLQMLSPDVVKIFVKSLLEIYKFGPTQEIMEALDNPNMTAKLSEDQLTQMKVAVLEALKDAGEVGQEASKNRVMENKIGTLEALKESGLADQIGAGAVQDNPELAPIPYKDAPEDIKRQMEANAGLKPSAGISPAGSDQMIKHIGQETQGQQQDTQNQQYQTDMQFKRDQMMQTEKLAKMKGAPNAVNSGKKPAGNR